MSKNINGTNNELTTWQKTHAAMQYYFASAEYLKQLYVMVSALTNNGQQGRTTGVYFTPSIAISRRLFHACDNVPGLTSGYGLTYWQWG